jgi:hypothetical protein
MHRALRYCLWLNTEERSATGTPSQQADRSVSLGPIAWCRRWVTASKAAKRPSSQGLDCSRKARPGQQRDTPDEETNDWRAVCGRTARTVRREGRRKPSLPLSPNRVGAASDLRRTCTRTSRKPTIGGTAWIPGTSPGMTESGVQAPALGPVRNQPLWKFDWSRAQ